jgi:nitrilase
MDETRLIAAAAQLTSGADLHANLATCGRLAAEAAARGAGLLVLPENFAFLGDHERDKFAVAEALDPAAPGPILGALSAWAREHHMWIIAGGLPERAEGRADKVHNTCAVVDPAGRLAASYRKVHLFDVDIPGGAQFRESDSTAAGDRPMLVDAAGARVGLSICYDVRFPELYRALVRAGAELIAVPAAFTAHTGAAHWHVLLRARAIENQCYAIAAAQSGRHNPRRVTYGHSLIIDPWGTVVAELAEGTGVITAEIDRELLAKTRREMPCLGHRVL